MSEKSIGVSLLGCGVVGTGVAHILSEQKELIKRRTGLSFDLRHVVVRDAGKPRPKLHGPVHGDVQRAIDDPKTDVVVELIGGESPAAEYIQRALRKGKPVITANKSLLATRGAELFKLARDHNTCIAFEASCAGGIPIINALTTGLVANRIEAMVGIVNGTCNFILTRMAKNGWTYAQALAEAQKAGFAEADPTLDVSGRDAAQKLAILGGLAFDVRIDEAKIAREGIDRIEAADLRYAAELGYVIKLLAIGQRHGDKISLRVHPSLLKRDDLLAEVNGSFNAVSLYGHALGHALFYGRGAGQMPTASAVVADLVSVGLGTAGLAFSKLTIFGQAVPPADLLPIDELSGRYYLRLVAKDVPGVMAQVTRILGEKAISIAAVMQHESENGKSVPVVITTHEAKEGSVQWAIKELGKLEVIESPPVCLRIVDQPREFAGT